MELLLAIHLIGVIWVIDYFFHKYSNEIKEGPLYIHIPIAFFFMLGFLSPIFIFEVVLEDIFDIYLGDF